MSQKKYLLLMNKANSAKSDREYHLYRAKAEQVLKDLDDRKMQRHDVSYLAA